MKLAGEVAIVTGGGRNIGQSICEHFAREGAKVAVVDIDLHCANQVSEDIVRNGGEAIAIVADVSKEQDIIELVGRVEKHWGRIDILVNNVAMTDQKTVFEIDKATWDRVIAVTLTAPFLLSKYAAESMKKLQIPGRIVNISSTSGFRGRERAIAYTSAKGGVVNLTRSLAVQLSPYGIRVNSIAPNKAGSPVGKVEFDESRPVINLKRNKPPRPIDIAKAALFLVTDESEFIVGHTLFVDGGVMVMEIT